MEEPVDLADLPDVKDMLPLDVRTQQAVELMEQGKIEQAIEELRQVTQASSAHHSSRIFLGEAFERQGRLDEAIKQYRSVVEARPSALDPRLNLGRVALQQGNLPAALQDTAPNPTMWRFIDRVWTQGNVSA